MPDPTSPPPQPSGGFASSLPVIREVFAGLIAILVLALFFWMMLKAFGYIESTKAASFDAIKELLAIINPVVGLIIGYYFSRITTESRAEAAEATAKTSARVADQANAERTQAVAAADAAKAREHDATSALSQLTTQASRALMGGEGVPEEAMGVPLEGPERRAVAARASLELALERARQVLAHAGEPRRD